MAKPELAVLRQLELCNPADSVDSGYSAVLRARKRRRLGRQYGVLTPSLPAGREGLVVTNHVKLFPASRRLSNRNRCLTQPLSAGVAEFKAA